MAEDPVDFDLHERIGIRLLGAKIGDARAVARQLGLPTTRLVREPDITVRFVADLPIPADVRLLGTGDFGYDSSRFFVFRGKGKAAIRAVVPLDSFGDRCEFVCQSGISAVPLLVAAINLRALAIGLLPMHACAFSYGGQGILCTGWSKGGKTETLLGFMEHGARYIGDEWVYLDGTSMFGIPEPVHVWDWHLPTRSTYRRRIGWRNRARLAQSRAVARGLERVAAMPLGPVRDIARRLMPVATRQRHVKVTPQRLFGEDAFQPSALMEHVVFVHSYAAPSYVVHDVEPNEIANRMVHSLLQEQAEVMSTYEHFRFAFPQRSNR